MNELTDAGVTEIVKQRYFDTGVRIYGIYDSLPENCHPYNLPKEDDHFSWAYVLFQRGPMSDALMSSQLCVIDRRSGKVIYEGSASDEG